MRGKQAAAYSPKYNISQDRVQMFIIRECAAVSIVVFIMVALAVAVAIAMGHVVKATVSMVNWIILATKVRNARIRVAVISSATNILVAVFLLTFLGSANAQQSTPSIPSDPAYTINVNVNEVVLHATVRNHKGVPVAGLDKENFQVFEDHVQQSIKHFSHEDVPVTVGIVIDNSGSMQPKRAEVIAAALAFADSSNPQDQMFLVNFNEHVSLGLPPDTPFTDDTNRLRAAMATVRANGKTALYDAVIVALEHIKSGTRDKKVLIVVSDGADNASVHTKAQMLALAVQSNAIIYTLAIYEPDDPENRDPRTLEELSKASGGEAYLPKELREVRPISERIAHEIRNQYTITYIPTNQARDGSFRKVQLRAASPQGLGLDVTTRTGYISPLRQLAPPKPEARN